MARPRRQRSLCPCCRPCQAKFLECEKHVEIVSFLCFLKWFKCCYLIGSEWMTVTSKNLYSKLSWLSKEILQSLDDTDIDRYSESIQRVLCWHIFSHSVFTFSNFPLWGMQIQPSAASFNAASISCSWQKGLQLLSAANDAGIKAQDRNSRDGETCDTRKDV